MNGGTKTETDTGVAVTANVITEFKIEYENATKVVFKIAGSVVATHTTNLPATDLGLIVGGNELTTTGKQIGWDYVQVEYARTGGIGGGSGTSTFPDTVPFTTSLLFTDFYDNFNVTEFGNIQGQDPTGANFNGIKLIDLIANTVGEFGGVGVVDIDQSVDSSRYTDPTKDFDYKCRQILGTTANRIDWTGMFDFFPADSGTLATAEANITNGIYFRAEDGGNWQAVSRASSTNTVTDTGVATTTTNTLFEIIKTGSTVVFRINDSTVATHTTNIPSAGIFLISGVNGKTQFATFEIELDMWYLLQAR